MSIDLSVSMSGTKLGGCGHILKRFYHIGVPCRTIETLSVTNGRIEKGCLVTLDSKYSDKKDLRRIWESVKGDYTCAHLSIGSIYSGCIYNYINTNNCPMSKKNGDE